MAKWQLGMPEMTLTASATSWEFPGTMTHAGVRAASWSEKYESWVETYAGLPGKETMEPKTLANCPHCVVVRS